MRIKTQTTVQLELGGPDPDTMRGTIHAKVKIDDDGIPHSIELREGRFTLLVEDVERLSAALMALRHDAGHRLAVCADHGYFTPHRSACPFCLDATPVPTEEFHERVRELSAELAVAQVKP